MAKTKKMGLIVISLMAVILFAGCESGINVNSENLKNNCQEANNNYAMFEFEDDETTAQHKLIKLDFDENCNLKNIFEWVEEENSFKTKYFRGYE